MFEDADNFADVFRGSISYYLLITLPFLILCFSNPILASSEFSVQRMSQFDVNGVAYGCRASTLNLEAKSLYTWSNSRHCVVTRLQDITIDHFQEIRSKAGGLVILLPKNLSFLKDDEKQQLYLLEQAMLSQEIAIPIYFSSYNEELDQIIKDISRNIDNTAATSTVATTETTSNTNNTTKNTRQSALTEILTTISANGYQIFVSGGSNTMNKLSMLPIIQGELAPIKQTNRNNDNNENTNNQINDSRLPVIIIVAHLDTFGLYNEYLFNSDVAVTLTLAELFSKMHTSVNSAPKYRMIFLISESGALLNFQGVKKWLDENTQIQNVDFVLCLDTITQPIAKPMNSLFMHVSKPPKENTPMSNFYKQLKLTSTKYSNIINIDNDNNNDNFTIEGIHKKINLADTSLGWEHERFSMKRFPAFTISSLRSYKDPIRTTIFKDDYETKNRQILLKNTQKCAKILAESLARYIYNIHETDNGEIFSGAIDISYNSIAAWMNIKSLLHNNDLKNAFEKYLKNVKIIYEKPDTKEPDFMLYDGQYATLFVYRVKPAVFDLFLTLVIAAYLGCAYLVIKYFPHIYEIVCKMSQIQTQTQKSKVY